MTSKPFKVLLVDDEQNTRNLLKLCIDWEALGMEVVADAVSGIEALSIIEELRPDIVLTDIEMPYMDGIALSKQIMEHYIDTYVVIITAHEQFTYAQQAISIGVSDFILKPIDAELITNTLKALSEKIIKNRKKLVQLEVSYKYIKNNVLELRNQFLNGLINGNTSNTLLFNELEITKILSDTSSSGIQVALINMLFNTSQYTPSERQSILQNCMTYIEETFCGAQNLYVFPDVHHHIVLLCNEPDIYLPELCERITDYFKSNLNTKVYCGIGNIVSNLDDIASSYNDAKNALKLCYILDEEVIYNHHFEHLSKSYTITADNPLDHLILLIKSGLTKESVDMACELLHSSLQEGAADLSAIKYYAINLLSKVQNSLLQSGILTTSLNFSDLSYSYLINTELYADIEKYVMSTISEFCHLMNTINKSKQSDTVSQIIHYIETHYTDEDLSLTSLAKAFYINPSYLSRIFKKDINKSFTDYLVELRVQKAIGLLQLSSYKAYQLGQMVGIPDPNYFIKCFKKVTGVSLQEFKNQMK
ncbi:MAG: two component transcriptional regulator, AraC family [Clostridia bacterium]|jgi:two-component system response regulator YesN|nr:two component transcriptional regulator, AraC family [Clostridia bacterium]